MTAEVAVLNNIGVALAADSTVTIKSPDGDKTYNTANKLFTLSKFQPVGVLIYGSTEINSVPCEVLIKQYRAFLHDRKFDDLNSYVNSFLRFLRSKSPIGEDESKYNVGLLSSFFANLVLQIFFETTDEKGLDQEPPKIQGKVEEAFNEALGRFDEVIKQEGPCPALNKINKTNFTKENRSIAMGRINKTFKGFEISKNQKEKVFRRVINGIFSNIRSPYYTGIAIAGYGHKDFFPRIVEIETDGFISGALKITRRHKTEVHNLNMRAAIVPLAQRDIVDQLVQGVHTDYQALVAKTITGLIEGIPSRVEKLFDIKDKAKVKSLETSLNKEVSKFKKEMRKFIKENYISKMIDAIRFLEKDELAILAESLVSITALKRKISLEMETVGGPIDVAVISKIDGFIWIQRKHYFKPELNRSFFENYLKKNY